MQRLIWRRCVVLPNVISFWPFWPFWLQSPLLLLVVLFVSPHIMFTPCPAHFHIVLSVYLSSHILCFDPFCRTRCCYYAPSLHHLHFIMPSLKHADSSCVERDRNQSSTYLSISICHRKNARPRVPFAGHGCGHGTPAAVPAAASASYSRRGENGVGGMYNSVCNFCVS